MPAGHLEQMQSFLGPRVPPEALQPTPHSGAGLPQTWCSSVPLAGAAVDRAVVGEALVHPFPLGWGAALRLTLLTLQGAGLPHEGGQAKSRGLFGWVSHPAGSPAV